MQTTFIGLTLLLFCTAASCLKFTDCGQGTVTDVKVSGCEKSDVCPLKRGTLSNFTVSFKSKTDTSVAKAVVHGIISGVPLPFPLPNPDGCKSCGLACPLKKDQSYVYGTAIQVKNSYPPVKVTVKWELKDGNGVDLFCILVPTQIG